MASPSPASLQTGLTERDPLSQQAPQTLTDGVAVREDVEAGMEMESALQTPAPATATHHSLGEPSGSFARPAASPEELAPFAPGEINPEGQTLEQRFDHLLETVHRNRPNDDLDLIRRAWAFCIHL